MTARDHAPAEDGTAMDEAFRAIFRMAPLGMLRADAAGQVLDANATACWKLGYSRAELLALSVRDLIGPMEVWRIDQALADLVTQGVHARETTLRRKDGTVFGAIMRAVRLSDGTLVGMFRSVTGRSFEDEYRAQQAAIIESASDAVISLDLDGRVRSWNTGAAALYGYTAEEMLGRSISAIVPEELAPEFEFILQTVREGRRIESLATRRRRRDGTILDVSISSAPVFGSDGQLLAMASIQRDMTALRAHQRESQRLSDLYAALSAVNHAIVWSRERDELLHRVCAALVRHGRFPMAWVGLADPETHRLVPVASAGDINQYLRSVEIYVDDRPQARGPSGQAFRTGTSQINNKLQDSPSMAPWREEQKRRGYQASAAFPIRQGGRPVGSLAVYSMMRDHFQGREVALLEEAADDISFALDNFAREDARTKAEQAVRDEKRFSDTMLESMPGIVYFYDRAGRFLRWNRNFETISGYGAAEIARMHPREFFAPEHRSELERRIAEVFETGEALLEAPFLAKDGTLTPYLFTGRRVVFGDGMYLVGMGIDITARYRAEAEHERRMKAEAADHIKSAFLATMSHELRTPLNSIIGFTGILLQQLAGPLNGEQAKQLDMVRGSARHLLALVNDVLDISKIEANQLRLAAERFDAAATVRKAAETVAPQAAARGLSLTTEIDPALGPMTGDERRFGQVLLNLLSNAVKFTERGGISLSAAVAGGNVTVRVADTGIGIAPAHLAELFTPFRQIDSGLTRRHDGTGLGLAISRRLVDLMGGTISVTSEYGQGTVFLVTVPLEPEPGRVAAPAS